MDHFNTYFHNKIYLKHILPDQNGLMVRNNIMQSKMCIYLLQVNSPYNVLFTTNYPKTKYYHTWSLMP